MYPLFNGLDWHTRTTAELQHACSFRYIDVPADRMGLINSLLDYEYRRDLFQANPNIVPIYSQLSIQRLRHECAFRKIEERWPKSRDHLLRDLKNWHDEEEAKRNRMAEYEKKIAEITARLSAEAGAIPQGPTQEELHQFAAANAKINRLEALHERVNKNRATSIMIGISRMGSAYPTIGDYGHLQLPQLMMKCADLGLDRNGDREQLLTAIKNHEIKLVHLHHHDPSDDVLSERVQAFLNEVKELEAVNAIVVDDLPISVATGTGSRTAAEKQRERHANLAAYKAAMNTHWLQKHQELVNTMNRSPDDELWREIGWLVESAEAPGAQNSHQGVRKREVDSDEDDLANWHVPGVKRRRGKNGNALIAGHKHQDSAESYDGDDMDID